MTKKLRITYLLPREGHFPSGGLRIIYEYANRLARRGHDVSLVHPSRARVDSTFSEYCKSSARYLLRKCMRRYGPESWFCLESAVHSLYVPSLASRWIPDADVVVATGWQTAEWARGYPPAKGSRFYFIQHLEDWNGPAGRVRATWEYEDLQKIVISKWLMEKATEFGTSAIYIPNAIDDQQFKITNPPESRDSRLVMALYHQAEWKGSQDLIEALKIVRSRDLGMKAILFGVPAPPRDLPKWITYHRAPAQDELRRLYNSASIFVAPSWTEGWGLPACEAILCGTALVATDIDGHREFAVHGCTALLSPPKCPEDLADNILRLIGDHQLRLRLVRDAEESVRQFTWDKAIDRFEIALKVRLPDHQSACDENKDQ